MYYFQDYFSWTYCLLSQSCFLVAVLNSEWGATSAASWAKMKNWVSKDLYNFYTYRNQWNGIKISDFAYQNLYKGWLWSHNKLVLFFLYTIKMNAKYLPILATERFNKNKPSEIYWGYRDKSEVQPQYSLTLLSTPLHWLKLR